MKCDISEMNDRLAASEERFRMVLANMPVVLFQQDTELRYTWIYNLNSGFSVDEMIGRTDMELFPLADHSGLTKIKRKVLETGIGVREEVRTTTDGKSFYYDLCVEPQYSAAAVLVGVNCISTDITERKKMEQQLLFNQRRLETLIILNQMTRATLKEIIKIVHREALNLTGSEIGWLEFLNEDEYDLPALCCTGNREVSYAKYERVHIRPGIETVFVSEAIHQRRCIMINHFSASDRSRQIPAEGHTKLKRLLVVPVMDGDRSVAVISVANKEDNYESTDIQQLNLLIGEVWQIIKRRHAEENLLQLEASFRKIVETANEGIIVGTSDGKIRYLNNRMADMLGYTVAELQGKNGLELLVPSQEPAVVKTRAQLAAGTTTQTEVHFCKKDGKSLWTLANSSPIFADDGKYVGNLAMHTDITERKRSEEALRQSEERFAMLFHESPVLMALAKIDETSRRIEYVDANQKYLEAIEYSLEEIIGKTPTELNLFSDDSAYGQIYADLTTVGFVNNLEREIRTRSGGCVHGLTCFRTITINLDKYVLAVILDITEKKRYESELARLDQLNLVAEMAAGIGHEVRNPMTTVRGFLQMLSKYQIRPHETEIYQLMIEELDRANNIITEFLSLARNDSIVRKPINLNDVVRALFPLIQAEALLNDHTIILDLHDVPAVLVNENDIRQLIHNLTRNGLEAMSSGKTMTIQTTCRDDQVVLSVADQGSGLSPEIAGKLGKPFITTKEKGTGLGLAVCYSIAARHQASIEVESGTTGTVFKVSFPTAMGQHRR